MAGPATDPAALRALDSLAILPSDLGAAVEEIVRRREESGFSYFVVGANAVDVLAPSSRNWPGTDSQRSSVQPGQDVIHGRWR
jgi:hypothetical protein